MLTGPLNISLLACAATPPLILGSLERRAATPLTLNLSEKVAICVSEVVCTSRAVGGAMVNFLLLFFLLEGLLAELLPFHVGKSGKMWVCSMFAGWEGKEKES